MGPVNVSSLFHKVDVLELISLVSGMQLRVLSLVMLNLLKLLATPSITLLSIISCLFLKICLCKLINMYIVIIDICRCFNSIITFYTEQHGSIQSELFIRKLIYSLGYKHSFV